jgi:hypothetical protein
MQAILRPSANPWTRVVALRALEDFRLLGKHEPNNSHLTEALLRLIDQSAFAALDRGDFRVLSELVKELQCRTGHTEEVTRLLERIRVRCEQC